MRVLDDGAGGGVSGADSEGFLEGGEEEGAGGAEGGDVEGYGFVAAVGICGKGQRARRFEFFTNGL